MIDRDINNLHPIMRDPVRRMMETLKSEGLSFRLFEGYRTPERQNDLILRSPPTTRARAWTSSHQYGLAVDMVGWEDEKWSWDLRLPWDDLGRVARTCGLVQPIRWDRPHIEHPVWQVIRDRL